MKAARALAGFVAGAALIAAAGAPAWRWPAGRAAPGVPHDNRMSAAKVELGRRLFYDADLSADGSMACSTCHVQRHAFADSTRTHPGVHGDPGRRNAPVLSNVAWRTPLTWANPRLKDLEAQVLIPVAGETPVEMGMRGREAEIVARIGHDACYIQMFAAAFPEWDGKIGMDTIARALASFQRTLISDRSPYDRWLAGDRKALMPAQQLGQQAFVRECGDCHFGPDLTDNRLHAIGAGVDDPGAIEVTGRPRDKGRFRTPSLRNLAFSAPYLHDGSAPSIAEAIARHRPPGMGQIRPILAFLDALNDPEFVKDKRYALPDTACGKPL